MFTYDEAKPFRFQPCWYGKLEKDFFKQTSMEIFLKILENLLQSQQLVKRNKDLEQIIYMLRVYTKKQLGLMCES